MSCGGTGPAQAATPDIQTLCDGLKDAAQQKASGSGWNGVFMTFEAHSFKSQVVAGANHFVKVKVADGKFAHVRIFVPLPHTGAPAEVSDIQVDKSEADEINYF
eukprot:NODE_3887_length_513_cov_98.922414_g3314_i0.p1 GENE.NODE_3887_length_513_cov_98.922414_g3314_i0~~NODE_3887_length_513_cov_98.922414_g3314_i0.p1  ORF type:complete len:104 (-),score=22.22 NODE_3887_length_513_cov_98.922414_g3314_i0:139-450(-)